MKPTREEVLKLAEKAGFFFHVLPELAPTQHTEPHQYSEECFHRFADLLQAKNDSVHVAVTSAKPDFDHLAEPVETSTNTSLDAARWRALLSSGRIRILGSAGFSEPPKGYTWPPDYRHFGMEIWTSYGKPGGYDFSPDNAYGCKVLTDYADAIIAAKSGISSPAFRPNEKDVVGEGK